MACRWRGVSIRKVVTGVTASQALIDAYRGRRC